MLTQARLKELLSYDPETGVFVNLKSGNGRKPVGVVVGSPHKCGYTSSMIDGKNYMHHRLAWLYVNGAFPPSDIDHINGVRTDNRLANLRAAERFENCQNAAPRAGSSPGIWAVGSRWRVRITLRGHNHNIGYYPSKPAAEAAYASAKARLHTFQPTTRKF